MQVWEILLLAVALSMDACTVAMTNGMTHPKLSVRGALLIGLFFGFFQFAMPVVGYFITELVTGAFMDVFESVSAWISFGLLAFLGGRMLFEGLREWRECRKAKAEIKLENSEMEGVCPCSQTEKPLTLGQLFMQAIATSVDALAVGVTLQMAAISEAGLALGVWGATGAIGVCTLALSFGAVYVGKLLGGKLADKASIFGGVVLIGIGLKILIESFL